MRNAPKLRRFFQFTTYMIPLEILSTLNGSLRGVLNALGKDGEWVKYKSKSESLYAMHEYVGGAGSYFRVLVFREE